MAAKQTKEEDVSLDQIISEMDMIIDDIIFNKTSKSQYVRKEGEKLLALQFPLSDCSYWDQVEKKYAALQQQALIYPENSEIQRIEATLNHFLNLDFVRNHFVVYANRFQSSFQEFKRETILLRGVFESLSTLKEDGVSETEGLQKLFTRKLISIGKCAFLGVYNLACARKWSIKTPVNGKAERWSDLQPGEVPDPYHLSLSEDEGRFVITALEKTMSVFKKAIDKGLVPKENNQLLLENFEKLILNIDEKKLEEEKTFIPDVLPEVIEPNDKQKKVLVDPWSVVPEISPTVSDVSTFEEPDHFRGFREKLEEAEKERDEAIWSLQENPKLKLFDNKKYKSLKKTVAKQDEFIEALKKGLPYMNDQVKQEYVKHLAKRKAKEEYIKRQEEKKKQRGKFTLPDNVSPSPLKKVKEWDLGFGHYDESISESDFHSMESYNGKRSKGSHRGSRSRGGKDRKDPDPSSSSSDSSSSSGGSDDDDDGDGSSFLLQNIYI